MQHSFPKWVISHCSPAPVSRVFVNSLVCLWYLLVTASLIDSGMCFPSSKHFASGLVPGLEWILSALLYHFWFVALLHNFSEVSKNRSQGLLMPNALSLYELKLSKNIPPEMSEFLRNTFMCTGPCTMPRVVLMLLLGVTTPPPH
jgi:hypothetical protein